MPYPKKPVPRKIKKRAPSSAFPSAVHQRQKKANQAGLLVTGELEAAIARCKAKVEKLAQECLKGNRKFRDIEFDILEDRERCLHAMDPSKPKYAPADIRRVADIYENPQFFVDGATASDLSQGALGDCWFVSALAVLATSNLIEKICVARNEKVGIYGFIFWRDSGWVDVIIDDLLFTKVPSWELLSTREQMLYHSDKDRYNKTARKGSKNLFFSKSQTDNETWVPLIEKAYAKLHGDYASLESGYTSEAVEDMTGGVATLVYVQDLLDTDLFWKDELMRVGNDRLFACFTPDASFISSDTDAPTPAPSSNGLMTAHAYSIIKAVEFKGRKFLRVRNPWGRMEWSGRWSDGSKEWNIEWAGELLKALDYEFGDDGDFVQEYCDFLESWAIVERSRLFDEDWVLSSQWLKASAGSFPSPWNYGDVSFTIKVDKPTPAVIVLAQLDQRFFEEFSGRYRWSLDFTVYPKQPHGPAHEDGGSSPTGQMLAPTQPPVPAEALGSAIHSSMWDRSVKMEVELPYAGEYVVQVRLDRSEKRGSSWLSDNAPSWNPRKFSRKHAEYVLSQSIAANFDPARQGLALALPMETFADKNLTDLELEALAHIQEHRKHAAELFKPSKAAKAVADQVESSNIAGGATENQIEKPADFATEKVAHDTIPEPEPNHQDDGNEPAAEATTSEEDTDEETPADDVKDTGDPTDADAPVDKTEVPGGVAVPSGDAESVTAEIVVVQVPSAEKEANEEEDGEPAKCTHDGFYCNGCRGPIVGIRYHCVDVTCPDYDLCESCEGKKVHNPDHVFMPMVTDADDTYARGDREGDHDQDNHITLGLRVYTMKEAPASVVGHLRNGNILRSNITMSKVL